jgi:tetratricopeptide (TPR) repeat protein
MQPGLKAADHLGVRRQVRRDDVCFQCHMLPTVAVMPVRRFERADYCFRPGKDLADYQLVYVIRERGKNPGERFEINHLLELLRRHPVDSEVPYMDLAWGLLSRREHAGALQILEAVSGRFGESPRGLEWSAVALLGQGETEAAELRLRRALELVPDRPEALFNLALVLDAKGEFEAAEARLRAALALRPPVAKAWYYLGKGSAGAGRPKAALAAYRRALEIDPMHGRSYLEIAEVLKELGQDQEALRYLRHGIRHARKPEPLHAALAAAAGPAIAGGCGYR